VPCRAAGHGGRGSPPREKSPSARRRYATAVSTAIGTGGWPTPLPHAEMSTSSVRKSMHLLGYSLTLFRPCTAIAVQLLYHSGRESVADYFAALIDLSPAPRQARIAVICLPRLGGRRAAANHAECAVGATAAPRMPNCNYAAQPGVAMGIAVALVPVSDAAAAVVAAGPSAGQTAGPTARSRSRGLSARRECVAALPHQAQPAPMMTILDLMARVPAERMAARLIPLVRRPGLRAAGRLPARW
jgi:hypothetical protein